MSTQKRSVDRRSTPAQGRTKPVQYNVRTTADFHAFATALEKALGLTRADLIGLSMVALAARMSGGEVRIPYHPTQEDYERLAELHVEARSTMRHVRLLLRRQQRNAVAAEVPELVGAVRALRALCITIQTTLTR